MGGTMVLGVGNPWRGDDGVGPAVVTRLRGTCGPDVRLEEGGTAGLALLELMLGYERVIVVDAVVEESGEPGRVAVREPKDFPVGPLRGGPHGAGLLAALELGRRVLPGEMPRQVVLVTITIRPPELGEGLSPPVAAAVTAAAGEVRRLLARWAEDS